MKQRTFNHTTAYTRGQQLLERIQWTPNPDEMLKLPSHAKKTELRALCEPEQDIEHVHLAARLEHLATISGEAVRAHLVSAGCVLSTDQIARLCRRMAAFIAEKLKAITSDHSPSVVAEVSFAFHIRFSPVPDERRPTLCSILNP